MLKQAGRSMRLFVALLCLSLTPPAVAQAVLELRATLGTSDDYLCWSPVRARVRLAAPDPSNPTANTIQATVASEADAGGGAIGFQLAAARPLAPTYDPKPSIVVSLSSAWTDFWVSGLRGSDGDKDVRILVRDSAGTTLASLPVMVRVRKNADTLSAFERGLFMAALARMNGGSGVANAYRDYWKVHGAAARLGIHRSPLFLPWHRAFLLNFERQLQAIDPRVAIPYWRYDQPSTNVFTSEFMGVTEVGKEFAPEGALERWADDELGRLIRYPIEQPAGGISAGVSAADLDPRYLFFEQQLEGRFHNPVHSKVGGWLASGASPADPLFFLLHANVDRLWVHWQWKHDRFSNTDELAYSAQGAYPGTGPDAGEHPLGVYVEDGMWPWTSATPSDPYWPPGQQAMAAGLPGTLAQPTTPRAQLDPMGSHGESDLGYCYDDIGYAGVPVPLEMR